ncbi:MAG: DNA polymerase III subunit delta' [Rhodomicrobium sp.]
MAKSKSSETKSSASEEAAPEGLALHPRLTPALFGHAAAGETFLRAFNAGALHHAWLVTGERGIGKATFAYRAARFLLSRERAGPEPARTLEVAPSHPAARQISAGAHPSLFVLGEAAGAASIGVDEVRKLRSFLGLTSPGGWRAMIVDPANDLTVASANALLKAVEEPPQRTVFFLIGHGASTVMPTIRSRCVKLALRPLDPGEFAQAVRVACVAADIDWPDAQALEKLHKISAGSPGRAVEFLAGGLLTLAETLDKILKGLPRMDYGRVHSLIQSASGARNAQTFARLCDLIEERLESLAREAAAGGPGAAKSAAWAQSWQDFRQRRAEMEVLNLDKGAFLLSAFSDMESIARKFAQPFPGLNAPTPKSK